MKQDDIYRAAQGLLKDIEDIPMNRLTVGESLFLFRHCLRFADKSPTIIASFSENDLLELIDIVRDILARGGTTAVH